MFVFLRNTILIIKIMGASGRLRHKKIKNENHIGQKICQLEKHSP